MNQENTSYTKVLEPEQLCIFLREVSALNKCNHPNIVKLKSAGRRNDGRLFITTEYVGEDLNTSHLIDANIRSYLIQLVSAVSYCHSIDIYHRDIKPSNIMLRGNKLTLIDFGCCRRIPERDSPTTRISSEAGTYMYSPPESLEGKVSLIPRIDEWNIGCILYEMITGHPLIPYYRGASSSFALEYLRIMEKKPFDTILRGYTGELYNVCKGFLNYDPKSRLTCEDALVMLGENISYNRSLFLAPCYLLHPAGEVRLRTRERLFDWMKTVIDRYMENKSLVRKNATLLTSKYLSEYPTLKSKCQLVAVVSIYLSDVTHNVQSMTPEEYLELSESRYTIEEFREMMGLLITSNSGLTDIA